MNRISLTSTLLLTTILLWANVAPGQSLPPLAGMEQKAMSDTLQYALEYNKTNQGADWVNPDTARSGIVTPVRTFAGDRRQPCREFITTITINGKQQQGYGTACRQSNGTWHVASDRPPAARQQAIVPSRPVYVYQPPERYYVSPPYPYYNPYPVNFSFGFNLGYLFHGGSMHIGNYYPGGPRWYPRNHWRPNKHRYYRSSRHRSHYRPSYRQRHRW
jgi:surface antigen